MKSSHSANFLPVLTLALFLAAATATLADQTLFYAGTAKVKITPEEPGYLLAWDTHRKSEGVESDLWLRALAIEDAEGQRVVVVSADILGFSRSLSQACREDALKNHGLGPERLLLAASHTHNGPTLSGPISLPIYYGLSPAQAQPVHAYTRWLREKVDEVIGRALGAVVPVRLYFGRGTGTFAVNRRPGFRPNPKGPSDQDVPVLVAETSEGGVQAVVFTYACHGTTVMADTMFRYFGDYPGVAADELEELLPGATALFIAGCGGDITPDPRGTVEITRQHGRALAQVVQGVATRHEQLRPLSGPIACLAREIELPLDKLPSRAQLTSLEQNSWGERQRYAREMLRQLDAGELPGVVPYPILVWGFGRELALVALAGEVCVDYALRLKRELGGERTWVAAYATEVPAYIPSERVLLEGGYEAGWDGSSGRALAAPSMSYYGWPAPFAPGLETKIVSTVREMAIGSGVIVLPEENEPIWDGGLAPGWRVESGGGAAFIGARAFGGTSAAACRLEPEQAASVLDFWTLDFLPAASVPALGYEYIRLRLHPGTTVDAEPRGFSLYINNKPIDLKYRIDFGLARWQEVEISLANLGLEGNIEKLRFWGWTQGMFYLDDVELIRAMAPSLPTQIARAGTKRPAAFALGQNFPNPFNSRTSISFELRQPGPVELAVFDLAGQRVATLAVGEHRAETHQVRWDGRDGRQKEMASGIYFYRLRHGNGEVETRKLVLVR